MKYNDLKASKPGLKPVVVYLTMENSIDETIKRIWVHHFGNDSQMGDYEPNEAIQMLEKAGIFTPNKPNKPELVIWHRSNKSINTADMRAMIEDLEKSGKQCVLLIQDYLKRIRPVNKSAELRIELSNISDEFNTIAKELDIPIVTAMQLNREAFKLFEDSNTIEGQINAVERMGASHVGESIDVIQNVDFAFVIGRASNPQLNDAGEIEQFDRFLVFKLIKSRTRAPKVASFKHRFRDGNDLALMEDFNAERSYSSITTADMVKENIDRNGIKSKGRRQV